MSTLVLKEANQLAKGIREGTFSSVEVIEAHYRTNCKTQYTC
jgi:hypothetical protein